MLKIEQEDISAYLGKIVTVMVDRPLGSRHPRHLDIQYPVNYGYIPGILGGDGEPQDVYLLGVYTPVEQYTAQIIALVHRENDVEDKLVAAPAGVLFSVEEILEQIKFQEQYFQTWIQLLQE